MWFTQETPPAGVYICNHLCCKYRFPPTCTVGVYTILRNTLFSCPRVRGRRWSADVLALLTELENMTKSRSNHNIKLDKRRRQKQSLISGNPTVVRKDPNQKQITTSPTDYSEKGWIAFTDWNKNRYVLPVEFKEYNITNQRFRSPSGQTTLGVRTPDNTGRPLGGRTQVQPLSSAVHQYQGELFHSQLVIVCNRWK